MRASASARLATSCHCADDSLDIFLQRDITEGTLTETGAQELIDDLVIKLRIIRFLRTPSTTICSPATPPGSPRRSAVSTPMAARWSPEPASGSCRPSTTSARHPNRT
ncbi:pyruvate formate lyase family protein [Micromonospora sp. M12]